MLAAVRCFCSRGTIFVAAWCLLAAGSAQAARPDAVRLLPKNTYIFVRVANVPDFKERFQRTAFGRMAADPQIAPLVEQVYGAATQALADAEDKLGMKVSEILAIPQGEVAFAMASLPDRPKMYPILLLDVGDKESAAEKLLDSAVSAANGVPAEELTYKETKIASMVVGGKTFFYCTKGGTMLLSLEIDLIKSCLDAWSDRAVETLSENDRYAAIMKHCTPANGQEPQLSFFVDPVGAFRVENPDSMFTAMLSTWGLDGVMGVGGSATMADGEFDTLMHLHVLLDNPRTGVVGLIALTAGDSAPEPWVPGDAAAYLTIHWDVGQTFQRASKVVDSICGEGFLAGKLREQSTPFGVDAEKEVLPALAGRFTQANWLEKPITPFSQVTVFGAKLKDVETAQKALDNFVAKVGDRLEKKSYGGVTYYVGTLFKRGSEEQPWQHSSVAIVEDYLLIADRPSALEKAILTQQGDVSQRLSAALEYKLVANKIARQPGGKKPGMSGFRRPEESLRYLYDLAASDGAQAWVKWQGEKNKFFKQLGGTMETNPLPPFSAFTKYLAPGGSLITDEETGLHYTSFGLRRE